MRAQYPFTPLPFRMVVLLIALGWNSLPSMADWPQLLGPTRNGHAKVGTKLPTSLKGSIQPAWEVECGQGYAGVAVADGKVVLFDRVGERERLRQLDSRDGSVLWTTDLVSEYRTGMDSDLGPRSVPSIFGDRILTYGASGQLSCVEFASGKVLWSRAIRSEYAAPVGYFGAGSTPLIVGNKAVINVGGKKEGGIVAVDLETGKNVWMATSEEASYASPIELQLSTPASEPIALVPTRLKAIAIGCNTGKIAFEFPFGLRGPTVNAATPLQLQNGDVFLTASYGIGSFLMKPSSNSMKMIYRDEESLVSSQYCTPVEVDGFLYASDGREDSGDATFKCIDPVGKKIRWETKLSQVAHVLAVEGRLLVISVDGTISVFAANSMKAELISQGQLPSGKYRSIPAISDSTLYLRSGDFNQPRKLMAIR